MEEEVWVDIIGHPNYQVSNHGRILFKKTGRIRKLIESRDEYLNVGLNEKMLQVHRIVAIHFIPNPNNLPLVDHDDGNRKNNFYKNLKWCTQSYNLKKMLPQTKKRNYKFLTEEEKNEIVRMGNEKKSLREISRQTNRSRHAIRTILKSL